MAIEAAGELPSQLFCAGEEVLSDGAAGEGVEGLAAVCDCENPSRFNLTRRYREVILKNRVNILSEGKRRAISQTLLDCGKILLATLVAADFIKFNLSIKIVIVITMVVTMTLGIIVRPDEGKGE